MRTYHVLGPKPNGWKRDRAWYRRAWRYLRGDESTLDFLASMALGSVIAAACAIAYLWPRGA